MYLSIVIIGDEILLGRVQDTNSGLIARKFSEYGREVKCVRSVGDKAADIRAAIEASMAESSLVICTGGLGPTRDDITKPLLADIFGGEMIEHEPTTANIKRIFAERGLQMNELTARQALVPSSCKVIVNRYGTAPVMWFEKNGKVLVAMPGVPFETRGMLPEVMDCVKEHFGNGELIRHREFTVTGISESALAERLAPYEDSLPQGYKLAYLPVAGAITMRLDGKPGADEAEFESFAARLCDYLGDNCAGTGVKSPAELLLHALRRKKYTLACAESCTGGNISHLVTEIAGCSDVFLGGVTSYANEVKMNVLGVNGEDINRDGAVSESVVRQMAEGVARITGADCSVATSGIAGPGGAVEGKPVGTVWIAVHVPGRTVAKVHHFTGDRAAVIERASAQAINMLRLELVELG